MAAYHDRKGHRDCEYLLPTRHVELTKEYEEVGKMLGTMMSLPERFMPRAQHRE